VSKLRDQIFERLAVNYVTWFSVATTLKIPARDEGNTLELKFSI